MVDELYCFLPIGNFIRYSQPLRKQTKVGKNSNPVAEISVC